jgi:hypothetical protein
MEGQDSTLAGASRHTKPNAYPAEFCRPSKHGHRGWRPIQEGAHDGSYHSARARKQAREGKQEWGDVPAPLALGKPERWQGAQTGQDVESCKKIAKLAKGVVLRHARCRENYVNTEGVSLPRATMLASAT